MFNDLKISHYIIFPISLALLVAMSGWFISFKETQKLRRIEIINYSHDNNIINFDRFKSGFTSLLIFSDLIMNNKKEVLIDNYLEQSAILNRQIHNFSKNNHWCCESEKLNKLTEIIDNMKNIILRLEFSRNSTPKKSNNYLIENFEGKVSSGLNIINIISKQQANHAELLKNNLLIQTKNYQIILIQVFLIGIASLLLLWWLISKTITRPITSISKAAKEALDSGHFKNKSYGPVELRGLNNSLECLTNQLEQELESERVKIQRQEEITRAQLWETAHIDPLTHIANRNLFDQQFNRMISNFNENNNSFNICVIDVNEFKNITHIFGHISGNNLLVSIADILKESINKESLVCRNNGDEFALLIKPAMTYEQKNFFFEEVINKCAQVGFSDNTKTGAQISIGVAEFPIHGNNNQTLYQAAQTAMFNAKKERLHGSCWKDFQVGMDSERIKIANLKDQIDNALEEKQFKLYFQPVLDSASNNITAAEALLRWPGGPSDIQIPEIISIAEQSGLILKLGDFIIDEAFKMLSVLDKKNLNLSIAINISPIQFRYQNLTELIIEKSQEYSVDPKRLTIEITESTFLDDIEYTKNTLKILQEIGVSISIDDFGTGYSSLSYLQNLSVDWIKIDKSFINDIDEKNSNLDIVRAITQMGHAMNIGIVAEGVETERQSQILNELNCECFQGYLISKPMPEEEFISFSKNTN